MSKTALLEAVRQLNLAAVERLLDEDPPLLKVTDREGRNLLHLACSAVPAKQNVHQSAQPRLVSLLLKAGPFDTDAPVGRDACTALFFAVARARNPALVRLLLRHGASPTAAPGDGLFAAGWWDDVETLELLIRAGARVDIVVGVTPFLASWGWRKFEAAKCLALHGADLNFQDRKGKTALHYGVEKQFDPGLLKWLVQHGASADVKDREGITPRLRASRKRDRKFAAALA